MKHKLISLHLILLTSLFSACIHRYVRDDFFPYELDEKKMELFIYKNLKSYKKVLYCQYQQKFNRRLIGFTDSTVEILMLNENDNQFVLKKKSVLRKANETNQFLDSQCLQKPLITPRGSRLIKMTLYDTEKETSESVQFWSYYCGSSLNEKCKIC